MGKNATPSWETHPDRHSEGKRKRDKGAVGGGGGVCLEKEKPKRKNQSADVK